MNDEQLAALSIHYEGNWNKITNAIRLREDVSPKHIKDKYITILDPLYPPVLKELENPPWVLFYQGDISLLNRDKIAIVGTRKPTEYGCYISRYIAGVTAKKYVIVSGMAMGVDAICHEEALVRGGKTIGILGHGLGTVYPYQNKRLYEKVRQDGLLISEFPHDTGIQKYYFPWRNRLIACLGEKVIVTQAALHSGTMHTVNEAIKLGRDVYCVPHPFMDIQGAGCNQLIQEGANLLYDKQSVQQLIE